MNELNSFQQTHSVIRAFFGDLWRNGPHSDITFIWPNMSYEADPDEYWVRFTINDGDSFSAGLGPHCRRYLGVISIQLFSPEFSGDAPLRDMADFISNGFMKFKYPNLWFKTPSIRDIGKDADWYQVNLVIEFERTSTGEMS